jgi:hypothetical protein
LAGMADPSSHRSLLPSATDHTVTVSGIGLTGDHRIADDPPADVDLAGLEPPRLPATPQGRCGRRPGCPGLRILTGLNVGRLNVGRLNVGNGMPVPGRSVRSGALTRPPPVPVRSTGNDADRR